MVSFVERFVILCPCLGESTIGGSTVACFYTLHFYVLNTFEVQFIHPMYSTSFVQCMHVQYVLTVAFYLYNTKSFKL